MVLEFSFEGHLRISFVLDVSCKISGGSSNILGVISIDIGNTTEARVLFLFLILDVTVCPTSV